MLFARGPTDYYAIESFFRHALWEDNGIKAEFVPIRPEMDSINPEGGWGRVLGWLNNNNPEYRIQNYFRGGVFAHVHGRSPIDVLLIQLDSDIFGNESFTNYVKNAYGEIDVGNSVDALDRANEIRNVLQRAAKFAEMTEVDAGRHVIAPAVENTEAWCVAAFNGPEIARPSEGKMTSIDFCSVPAWRVVACKFVPIFDREIRIIRVSANPRGKDRIAETEAELGRVLGWLKGPPVAIEQSAQPGISHPKFF